MGGKDTTQQKSETQQNMTRSGLASTQQPIDTLAGMLGGMLPQSGLNSNESGAIDQLLKNASMGNTFAPQISSLASDLLGGGKDYSGRVTGAIDAYRSQLDPTIRGDFLDPNKNPFFATTTNSLSDAAFNRVSNMYAGSGRDAAGAGSFGQNAGKGVAEAVAPVYAGVYNSERDRQLGAMGNLYAGENVATGLLSGLDQTSLQNRMQGVGVSGAAMEARDQGAQGILAAEMMRRGIPMQNMAQIAQLLVPLSQTGGTGTQTGFTNTSGEYNMSPAKQAWGWMNAFSNFLPGKPA